MRTRHLHNLMVAILFASMPVAGASPTLEPKVLSRIEQEFSQPSCGMSGPDGLRAQLESMGIADPLPYLIRMARKAYPSSRSWLNSTAIALIGGGPDPRAQETLRTLLADPTVSSAARHASAYWLATRFRDDARPIAHGAATSLRGSSDPSRHPELYVTHPGREQRRPDHSIGEGPRRLRSSEVRNSRKVQSSVPSIDSPSPQA